MGLYEDAGNGNRVVYSPFFFSPEESEVGSGSEEEEEDVD